MKKTIEQTTRLLLNGTLSKEDADKILLNICNVMTSLPSKDKAVDVGFTKAKNADYNYRKVLRDLDHDIYYSGWMDCFDWIAGNGS